MIKIPPTFSWIAEKLPCIIEAQHFSTILAATSVQLTQHLFITSYCTLECPFLARRCRWWPYDLWFLFWMIPLCVSYQLLRKFVPKGIIGEWTKNCPVDGSPAKYMKTFLPVKNVSEFSLKIQFLTKYLIPLIMDLKIPPECASMTLFRKGLHRKPPLSRNIIPVK